MLRLRSYRARIALAILVGLGLGLIGTQVILRAVLQDQVGRSLEQQLTKQATEIVGYVTRNPPSTLADAALTIPSNIYLQVFEDGDSVFAKGFPLKNPDAEVRVVRPVGPKRFEVFMQERAQRAPRSWLLATTVAGGTAILGFVVWFAAARIGRSLRRSAAELAHVAENLADGDLAARADVRDDELGRVAVALNDMARRLEQSDLRQREFLADAAHELRTPVTSIEGFAEALTDGTAASDEDRQEAASFIRDEAVRLRSLIRQLQDVTWEDLDPPIAWQSVDLVAIARDTVTRFEASAADAGLGIEAQSSATSLPVLSDPEHLNTILGNLVSNAIVATPVGGRVDIRTGRDAMSTWIQVADTGRGIAQEHLPYIFDRLFRVGTARDRAHGGSGLGLSIVRRLAQRLGGRVTVQSAPGEGTTFTLRLPLSQGSVMRSRRTSVPNVTRATE